MAKILTDAEMGQIIYDATRDSSRICENKNRKEL